MRASASEQVLYEERKVLVTNRRLVVGTKTYAIASITSVEHKRDARFKLRAIALGFLLVATTVGAGYLTTWHLYACCAVGVAALFLLIAFFLPVKHSVAITTASGEVQALSGWGEYKAGLVARVVDGINDAIIAHE
jgi:hypothetical protein